jgi:hypothetical protein
MAITVRREREERQAGGFVVAVIGNAEGIF